MHTDAHGSGGRHVGVWVDLGGVLGLKEWLATKLHPNHTWGSIKLLLLLQNTCKIEPGTGGFISIQCANDRANSH